MQTCCSTPSKNSSHIFTMFYCSVSHVTFIVTINIITLIQNISAVSPLVNTWKIVNVKIFSTYGISRWNSFVVLMNQEKALLPISSSLLTTAGICLSKHKGIRTFFSLDIQNPLTSPPCSLASLNIVRDWRLYKAFMTVTLFTVSQAFSTDYITFLTFYSYWKFCSTMALFMVARRLCKKFFLFILHWSEDIILTWLI